MFLGSVPVVTADILPTNLKAYILLSPLYYWFFFYIQLDLSSFSNGR
jgi:hypothetical protein